MSYPVLIVFGGTSSEHLVSVASAQHVVSILSEASTWFISPDGAVHECSREALLKHDSPFDVPFAPERLNSWSSLEAALAQVEKRDSVFFLALHGGEGEDGTVQKAFEQAQLAFTGPDSAASEASFDKNRAKEVAALNGLQVPRSFTLPISDRSSIEGVITEFFSEQGSLVVKPVADGSSYGVYFVRAAEEIAAVASKVANSGKLFVAEELVEGREFTIGVYSDENGAHALPPSEVILDPGYSFDYAGKYKGVGSTEVTPAQVSPELISKIQQIALLMHQKLGCIGCTRTDVIATPKRQVFLELNTLPGLTKASFIPQQLEAAGIEMKEFFEAQLELARVRVVKLQTGRS